MGWLLLTTPTNNTSKKTLPLDPAPKQNKLQRYTNTPAPAIGDEANETASRTTTQLYMQDSSRRKTNKRFKPPPPSPPPTPTHSNAIVASSRAPENSHIPATTTNQSVSPAGRSTNPALALVVHNDTTQTDNKSQPLSSTSNNSPPKNNTRIRTKEREVPGTRYHQVYVFVFFVFFILCTTLRHPSIP